MADKEPYLDLYTGDWMKDQAVSRCSPATRGIWMDLLCAMHDDSRSGLLSGTADQLARLGRCSAAELALALTDLQITRTADVTERNGLITVINRRMYRKAQEREKSRLRTAKCRAGKSDCNAGVTPNPRGDPLDSDSDLPFAFSGILPTVLDVGSFRQRLGEWIRYKAERRDTYKAQGLASMISRAASLAEKHGVAAVEEAMQRAIANRWAGWDHPGSFGGQKNGQQRIGSGQTHDPTASSRDPNHGRM